MCAPDEPLRAQGPAFARSQRAVAQAVERDRKAIGRMVEGFPLKSTALTPAIPRTFFSKPWTLFLVFLLVNALLAWMPLTVWQRLWFFPLGLILQVALALGTPSPPASGEPLFRKEFFKLSSP